MDDLVGDQRPSGAVGRGLVPIDREHAPQLFVGICDGLHRTGQSLADVGGNRLHVAPARAVGDRVAVLAAFAEDRLLTFAERAPLLALLLGDGVVRLAFPLVAEPFVEHQRQDVVLVVLPRRLATQDVRRAPQVGFELLEGESHRVTLLQVGNSP